MRECMEAKTMRLKVIKADGSEEEYLHTKVIGTISSVFGAAEDVDLYLAEQLAEVVTYFLYHRDHASCVGSGEILTVIQAVLTATGYEEEAALLGEHQLQRKLRRCRVEVVPVDIRKLADAEALCAQTRTADRTPWDKSRIVGYLIEKHGLGRQSARAVASMVEEKILNMNLSLVPASLVRQLVLSDAAAVLAADKQLAAV
jgi:hypothetical protein